MTLVDERDGRQIYRATQVEPAYASLLSTTRFGTDKLRYRRRRVRETMDRLPATDFYSVYRNDCLIGGYALTPVDVSRGDDIHPALYRHSLAINEEFQGQGLGRWLVETALRDASRRQSCAFSFGSVERGNRRSSAVLASASTQSIGTLRSELFYRQRTKRSETVSLNPDDVLLRASLDASEADCVYRFASRRKAPYYAVVDNGRILAGASARLNSLDLLSPGMSPGRLYASLVKLVPPARKRFDPADFRFVSLSDVVIDPQGGRAWNTLLGHILYEFDAHMAGVTLDPRRSTYQRLAQLGLLGRFAKATRSEFWLLAMPLADMQFDLQDQITGLAPLEL